LSAFERLPTFSARWPSGATFGLTQVLSGEKLSAIAEWSCTARKKSATRSFTNKNIVQDKIR